MADNYTSSPLVIPGLDLLGMMTTPTYPLNDLYSVGENYLNNLSDWRFNSTAGMFGSDNSSESQNIDSNTSTNQSSGGGRRFPPLTLSMKLQIPAYALIFLLSVVGNILVIVTVIQNRKMRSLTNVFLLNLSVSDLLLAVFCMPFTLVPMFLRNFIFGEVMCVAVRYMQGVSVAVSCFTLVAISLERYFAICHPLKSRRWQTLSHSYKAIAVCWACAFALMIPVAVYHKYKKIGPSRHICREMWPSEGGLKTYTVMINLFLLVLPIFLMTWAYGCVSYTLWIGMKLEKKSEKETQCKNGQGKYDCQNGSAIYGNNKKMSNQRTCRGGGGMYNQNCNSETTTNLINNGNATTKSSTPEPVVASRPFRRFDAHRAMRQSNTERSRAAKKRVIKMLFIIVFEFFIFWTPVYILNTWMTFDLAHAHQNITNTTKSLIHLLSYVSACCNPITYCFMNKNFRQGFLMAFRCTKKRYVYANRSQMSMNSGVTNSTRAPVTQTMTATSYDKIIDSDEISENSF